MKPTIARFAGAALGQGGGRVRDLKVAILQIPKKCAEICAYELRKEDSAARVRKKIAHGVR
jgi:hypothetical protein